MSTILRFCLLKAVDGGVKLRVGVEANQVRSTIGFVKLYQLVSSDGLQASFSFLILAMHSLLVFSV